MPNKFLGAVILLLTFSLGASAQYYGSQEAANVSLITVTGDAEIRVIPDEIILSLGIETSDKSLDRSKSQNDERVKRVLALGQSFQIDPKLIQTGYIGIEPWYRTYNQIESLEYRVRRSIAITLKDTTKFEDLLSQALVAGATNVHGIQFRTTELRKHRDAARALAIKAAKEKARALAAELGQNIGKAFRISEFGSGWSSPYGWWGSFGGSGASNAVQNSVGSGSGGSSEGTLALGQITVTASVSVSFLLQ
ncbi:MAG TPA: SIMPL domain-containing protein [Pyrinomonadaceae bacterium]|nr:SIMPL domain-containing protein [Pyrinomonadaceae bacterium]